MRGSLRARIGGLVALALGAALACASPSAVYQHSRYDYWSFRARVGSLPEPNYLPYVSHLEKLTDGARALVLCRWPNDAFPLQYHVLPPAIPDELQDEFNPRTPEEYVDAVHAAFKLWEQEIGRPVAFVPVSDPAQARLQVRLDAGIHSEEEVLVLGMVRDQEQRCRVTGSGDSLERVQIEFAAPEMYLFVSDAMGLLTPRQVHGIALHEIGHVLGAAGHSPLRADVMFPVATDRLIEALAENDKNTFRALYRSPPGAVYARIDEPHARPMIEARRGPPKLGSEVRDDRFGFAVRFPSGWQTIRTPAGWVAVDGLAWDYDASVQVIAVRGSLDEFVARQGPGYLARGDLVRSDVLELDGTTLARVVVRSPDMTELTSILDWGEGWLLLVLADSRNENFELYAPWFQQVLFSLERVPISGKPTSAPRPVAPAVSAPGPLP